MDDVLRARGRVMWAAVVLAVSVAALAVVPSLAATGSGEPQKLPDLDQAVPSNIGVQASGAGFDLVFDSAVDNVGDGPLMLQGARASLADETMPATQQVITESGSVEDVPDAGSLRYVQSVGHQHWHLQGFDRYELRRVGSPVPARPDRKTGFCIGDRYKAASAAAGARFRGNCEPNRPSAMSVEEGMSVGWGDNYKAGLEGQAIDVTGLEAGRYLLIHRVNADGLIKEKSTSNNAASALIDLSWPGGVGAKPVVKVLGQCPDTDTCARSSDVKLGTPVEVARGLNTPWEVLPLPDGRVLVSERPGRVRVIERGGQLRGAPVYTDANANKFLGMALDPGYASEPDRKFVYLYVSDGPAANPAANKIVRLRDDGTNLVEPQVIFDEGIRSDANHDGGRIAFGPDRKLYVTTGDVHDPALPQNLDSLNGKILRINVDGTAPADNPFPVADKLRRFVWSYGHRHPQGIGWDALGRMWESEHGPTNEPYAGQQGNVRGRDEINRIDRGANYGWPIIAGAETADDPDTGAPMRTPVVSSGTDAATTWAPGGLAFGEDGRMYVPALAGQHLRAMTTNGGTVTSQLELFKGVYGRLRTVVADGSALWLTTDDGPSSKVLRVPFGAAATDPGSAPGSDPAPATSPIPASAAPATGGSGPPAAGPRPRAMSTGAQLDALLARQVRALRRQTTARWGRSRPWRLRDRSLPPKRLALELVTARFGNRLARGLATTESGKPTSVAMNFVPGARAALISVSRRPPKLRLIARLRAPDGRLVSRSLRFTPARATK